MPRNRNQAKKARSADSKDKSSNSTAAVSESSSSASSSSNSFESANEYASHAQSSETKALKANKTKMDETPKTAPALGGETPPINFGFTHPQIIDGKYEKPVKPHPAGETSESDISHPFPQTDAEYASTLTSQRMPSYHPDKKDAEAQDARKKANQQSAQKTAILAPPSNPSAPNISSIDQWTIHHGAKPEEDKKFEVQGPQFDAELTARLNQLDPRADLPPQMAHLAHPPAVAMPLATSTDHAQTNDRRSNPPSRGSTPRHHSRTPLLPPNDHRSSYVTPMEDPTPPPRTSHLLHAILCVACCGLWIPCWIGACFGCCCERPLETAAHCCESSQRPTFETV